MEKKSWLFRIKFKNEYEPQRNPAVAWEADNRAPALPLLLLHPNAKQLLSTRDGKLNAGVW